MAEYAGLEIRIGGNTQKLTNALKASTKSAAELQRQIRQVTRAMQFDPANLKNVETRIKITGDRMQSLQSKVQITREAMRQLGDTMVKLGGEDKSVRDVASETENLTLKAKQADERFNKLTGSLAQIYEAWNKLSRQTGIDFARDKLGIDANTASYLMSTTTSLREFDGMLNQIADDRKRGDDVFGAPIMDANDVATLRKLKELNFHDMFGQGLDLRTATQEARDLGVALEDSAISNVRELQRTFKEAQQDKKAFDDALRFDQMGTDAQRLDSEIESLSQTMRKLDDGMTEITASRSFQGIEAEIRRVDAALANVEGDMERTGAAMKVDPGNIELAARYFNDLQQKAALSEEKMQLLNGEMRLLDLKGASNAVAEHRDLAKWVEESAEAARVANKELSEQRATVANLEDQTKGLRQAIAMVKGDETLAGYSDNVLKWKRQTEKLTVAMEDLAKAEGQVRENQDSLGRAQSNFDEESKKAADLKAQLEDLRQERERLDASMTEAASDPNVDTDTLYAQYARLQELDDQIEEVSSAYNKATREAEKFGNQLEASRERLETSKSSLQQQQEVVDDLSESVKKLENTREVKLFQNPTDEIEKAQAELKGLEGELDRAKAKENELEDAYDSAKTENELAKTAQAARDVSQRIDDTSTSMRELQDEMQFKKGSILNASTVKSIGMTLSATLTPLMTGVGYKMVDVGSEVDAAYRDMRKTVQGTEEQFEHLRSAAIDFSRTHVTSADQILQIEAIGGELGVATSSLETFAEVISNIDVATNLDVESAATALGHLANILHLTEDDYVGFSDALVRLGNNGASTETEIANIAERIGSMGSIVGMSGSDILAWSSSIASTGQRAEAAGTAISRTLSFFETAVASAGGTMDTSFDAINAAVQEGGDKLTVFASLSGMTAEEFAEGWEANSKEMADSIKEQVDGAKDSLQMIADVAHMSADEFAKTWEDDPTAAFKAFIEGLNDIEKAEGSADKVLQDLGITAVRQKQAIEGLMQTVGGLDDNLLMSEHAWNGVSDQWGQAGDAANEASKKAEGFSGQVQIMTNMWHNFLAELSEGAVPWIKSFTGILTTTSKWFSSLTADTKKWLVAIGGVAAAIGPILSIGASFATAAGDLEKWVNKVTSGLSLVKVAAANGGQEVAAAMGGTVTGMQKVGFVASQLGTTMLKGLAIGAVAAGIAVITYALSQLYEQYQDHIAATEGLTSAIAGIGRVSNSSVDGIDNAKVSIDELMMYAGKADSRLADLAKTLEDSNRQYDAYAGPLESYARTVETLGGRTDRTQDETNKLAAALQGVNDACGTTYGLDNYGNIIDTETGKIQENTDVIRANIELRKQQALIDYYSDDYAKAIGQQEDARQTVYDLAAEYRTLRTEAGKQDWIDNYIEKTGRADLAEEAFRGHLQQTKNALEESKNEFDRTSEVVSNLDGRISDATERMNSANKVVEDAARAQEEYDTRVATVTEDVTGNMNRMSGAVDDLGKSDDDFNRIAEGLGSISVSAEELGDVDMSRLVTAFTDANSSMSDVITTLEEGGVQMTTWNDALGDAPGAAERMGSVTAAAFASMYMVAGQNIGNTMTLIAGLDEVQVGEKTFYVGDNGTIADSDGKIYDLKRDMNSIPDQVIAKVKGDNKDAQEKVKETNASLDSTNKKSAKPSISAVDYATSTISGVDRHLRDLNGRTATTYVNTVHREMKQATGGMNGAPVIPQHATGYIATGPTLTNQGWIGEDGIEAVANWATGGAVVPLTNKRYMLPIADAIADGMSKRLGPAERTPVINVTVTGVVGPNDVADAVARRLAALPL